MIIDMTASAMEQKLTEKQNQRRCRWDSVRIEMIYGSKEINDAGDRFQCKPQRVDINSIPLSTQEFTLTNCTVANNNSIGFTYISSNDTMEFNFSELDAPVEHLDQSIEWWTI